MSEPMHISEVIAEWLVGTLPASCEGQTTHDGGVVLCGLPATTTATTDTGRAYPTCAEHGERESA